MEFLRELHVHRFTSDHVAVVNSSISSNAPRQREYLFSPKIDFASDPSIYLLTSAAQFLHFLLDPDFLDFGVGSYPSLRESAIRSRR